MIHIELENTEINNILKQIINFKNDGHEHSIMLTNVDISG